MNETTNIRWENGLKFLQRLQERNHLRNLEPALFSEVEFQTGSVVEVCGKSGVGKSELLLNFVAKCILPIELSTSKSREGRRIQLDGLQCHVMYLDNDHHFSMLRLATILQSRISKALLSGHESGDNLESRSASDICEEGLKNLTVMRCTDGRQLLTTLIYLEEIVVREEPFSVLFIDSISAFYWEDRMIFEQNYRTLGEHHRRMCDVLRKLTGTHKVTVFCTNQDLFKPKTDGLDQQLPINSVMGRDFQDLWNWRFRLTRVESQSNRVIVQVKHGDSVIRNVSIDISEKGVSFVS